MCISPGGAEYQMYSGGGGGIGIASTQNFGVWTGNGPGLKNVTFSIGALLDAGTFFKTQTSYKNVSASQYAKAYPDLASAILGNSAGMGQAGYVLAVEDLVIDQAAMDAANSGGMTFPSFSTLWGNYPPDVNGAHAHPSTDPYPNQCAIRVSDAFMKSGIDMSSYPKVNKTSDGYARSSKGLADWTWQNFGKPKIMSQDAFEKNYSNSTGLMYIAPPPGGVGHIDLFNAGSTGSGYYLGSEIWFWPIK